MKSFFLLFLLFLSQISFSQKKVIDYTAYNDWKTLSKNQLSPSGKFSSFEINPHRGDGYLYLYNLVTNKLDSFFRAKNATISSDEKYVVFTITSGFDTLRKCELNKIDKKKWPKDTLAVYFFENSELQKFAEIKSHQLTKDHNWLSYLENENKLPADVIVKKKKRKSKKKKAEEQKSKGTVLRIWNPISKVEFNAKNVTDYTISKDGSYIVYVENLKDSSSVKLLNLVTSETKKLGEAIDFKQLNFDERVSKLVFLQSNDTTKTKAYQLYMHDLKLNKTSQLIDTTQSIIPKGKSVSENRTMQFSKNGKLLYFGVAETPIEAAKDSLLESEKPKLDLWHYADTRLQTQQLVQLKTDLKQTDLYVYHFDDLSYVALTNDTLSPEIDLENERAILLAKSNEKYALDYQWDVSEKEDIYAINLKSGERKLLQKEVRYSADLSSKSDQLITFDFDTKQYQSLNIETGEKQCLTCDSKDVDWLYDVNGMPIDAGPRGFFGWNKGGTICYLKSRFDLYSYDFSTRKLTCVSNHEGKNRNIEFEARKWDYDSSFVDLSNVYLNGLNRATKGTHIYEYIDGKFVQTLYLDEDVIDLKKSKSGENRTMRSTTVSKYPEVMIAKNDWSDLKQISATNPSQSEYNWAEVELVKWKSYKGIALEGLLYRPENYDSTKKYPMIAYFYELYSDRLHNYYSPKPTASIVYPTEYASAGYFVFIPDIRYEEGHPGNSAYDCIMSGTDAILKLYPTIDESRLGLQGQSWGGYQTAQLITMTKRYKAAMAGAPVSNMFSAYGGIRWGSGVNRQFQYEKTQSRIGKTIWESPELYVENSPLFHLPNVTTPLLIMHNDGDGAVPWYQGIELYNGLRRLKKPCWLLNYNEDDHNLLKNANRIDLSIRMRQFFDYYLNNQAAPKWLIEGIPAVKKGEELRYELIEN